MSRYLSLSGALRCSLEQLDLVKESINLFVDRATEFRVSSEQAQLYLKGWDFPREHFNWLRYVFFGGDIQVYAEDYLINQMLFIVRNLKASSLEEKEIEGMFFYDEEDGDKGFWIINDEGVHCYVVDNVDESGRFKIDPTVVARLKKQFKV